MSPPRTPEQAMALLDRESCVRYGPVPHELGGRECGPERWVMHDGAMLLRCTSGFGFLYQRGDGVTVERPADPDPGEEALWLGGSVHCGIAALNGLMPLHASDVAHGGRVYAFTGAAGAGKSTMVAGLGQAGVRKRAASTISMPCLRLLAHRGPNWSNRPRPCWRKVPALRWPAASGRR